VLQAAKENPSGSQNSSRGLQLPLVKTAAQYVLSPSDDEGRSFIHYKNILYDRLKYLSKAHKKLKKNQVIRKNQHMLLGMTSKKKG